MSLDGPKSLQQAVRALSRLPGVGPRLAQRLVIDLMKRPVEETQALVASLLHVRENLKECQQCFSYTDEALCHICKDPKRDAALVCVVEEASDVMAIERSAQYRGVYHVLHGRLAPLDGIGPGQLRIQPLLVRIKDGGVRELLLATNPDVEGDATALYIANCLRGQAVALSRLAMGVPMGGHLAFLDQMTLGRAITERREFSST